MSDEELPYGETTHYELAKRLERERDRARAAEASLQDEARLLRALLREAVSEVTTHYERERYRARAAEASQDEARQLRALLREAVSEVELCRWPGVVWARAARRLLGMTEPPFPATVPAARSHAQHGSVGAGEAGQAISGVGDPLPRVCRCGFLLSRSARWLPRVGGHVDGCPLRG